MSEKEREIWQVRMSERDRERWKCCVVSVKLRGFFFPCKKSFCQAGGHQIHVPSMEKPYSYSLSRITFLITAQKNWLHYLVPRYCNSTMWKKETCSGDTIMKTLKASNCHYGNWFVCSCALPSHKLKISNLECGRIFLFLWRGNKTFIIWNEGINLISCSVVAMIWNYDLMP